jgi:RND family efflux transporter MFP subunit
MAMNLSRRRIIGAVVVLLIAAGIGVAVSQRVGKAGGAGDGGPGKGEPPVTLQFAPIDLAQVEAKSLGRWLPVSGAVQPSRSAVVKAKVAGEVRALTVREGEVVTAGQVIGRIDTADLEARLIERQGALESARAQLALAEKTRATNQTLLKQNFISQNAFDNSESSFNVARGGAKSAEAQVQIARNALKDAVLTAPLSGIVAKRHVQAGEKVNFDTPVVTVVDLGTLELNAMVPAVDVPELRLGMPVDLSIDGFGERRFSGRVERINPATEPGTRAIVVYVGIPNVDGTLKGGMFATGRIALAAAPPVPTLPAGAVRTEAGQSFVWTIDDGRLVRRVVVTGRRDDEAGRVEIKTALPAGTQVLAARFDNLKEGAPAMVKAPTSSTNATTATGGGAG